MTLTKHLSIAVEGIDSLWKYNRDLFLNLKMDLQLVRFGFITRVRSAEVALRTVDRIRTEINNSLDLDDQLPTLLRCFACTQNFFFF